MRHRKTVHKINKQPAHRRALLRNLLTSFFKHERVITTRAKAKAAQEVAERLIRYAISGTLADKRRIISYLRERDVAHKLIRLGQENFAKREHRGGFTAVYKYGFRKGDGAEMAILTLLTEEIPKDKKKRKKKVAEPEVIEAVETPVEETPVETAPAEETTAEATTEPVVEETSETETVSEETATTEEKVEAEAESAEGTEEKPEQSAEETPESEGTEGEQAPEKSQSEGEEGESEKEKE
ncbi:MAG TPA: 50S ribosomal protein L17 [candidate division Zixibacteria bacterium]|nr:50S ribosomal protein L17 [candidate division Zixibacteria bacterium]